MSEYTPTTSEVREAYEHGRGYLPPFYDPAYAETVREHQAQFDRWLAAHDRWLGKPQITDNQGEAEAMYPFGGGDPDTIIALRSAYRAGVAREGRAALGGEA